VDEQGRRSLLRLGYNAGFDAPAITLEGVVIGLLANEAAADALYDFLMAAAWMDPKNLTRAEP
jgi:hypothetical protein